MTFTFPVVTPLRLFMGIHLGYNGRGAQSPIAADEPSTGMALEETQVGQTRGDARNEVNEGCRIYHHNNVPVGRVRSIYVVRYCR